MAEGVTVHDKVIQKRAGRTLIFSLDDLLAETAFLCDNCQKFLVIKLDSIVICKLLTNFTASGTVLSSDGYDCFHYLSLLVKSGFNCVDPGIIII